MRCKSLETLRCSKRLPIFEQCKWKITKCNIEWRNVMCPIYFIYCIYVCGWHSFLFDFSAHSANVSFFRRTLQKFWHFNNVQRLCIQLYEDNLCHIYNEWPLQFIKTKNIKLNESLAGLNLLRPINTSLLNIDTSIIWS